MTSSNDLAAMAAAASALHIPLLGVRLEECGGYDEEMASDIELLDGENEENSNKSTLCGFLLGWIILPILLFVQFGLAFTDEAQSTQDLQWKIVNFSIALFVVTSWLFRHACRDINPSSLAIPLLPEMMMGIVLGLVLFGKVVLGFFFLLVSMLCLALFVAISCLWLLWKGVDTIVLDTSTTKGGGVRMSRT
ncbi:predicted protein [Phaeodactylum tricornutum CCAP 1055/1]|uniref:Transmembrane protein n=1 Tax=Phaeodactylum tricornutum (strain CCAP 1055/1) TaxID=556484 RepID=B7FYM4_PHATC|nr:predicted protein [Phaeodactylum tricornutum CCAP 1055/1]EEC48189.1 predicted protein [Phaeodactylum tricornutum CCAP 1055/1]|eukprot:XP_002179998.1 predicted protein [Phaeodactylum tricornutum CCAP 1055/1]